jgi:hypothetical protein
MTTSSRTTSGFSARLDHRVVGGRRFPDRGHVLLALEQRGDALA